MGPDSSTDPRTGRPLEPVQKLSQEELEAELTTAAATPAHLRYGRFTELLDERARRRELASTSA
jgi:hypothetical protein